jgi:hypothetical protein
MSEGSIFKTVSNGRMRRFSIFAEAASPLQVSSQQTPSPVENGIELKVSRLIIPIIFVMPNGIDNEPICDSERQRSIPRLRIRP